MERYVSKKLGRPDYEAELVPSFFTSGRFAAERVAQMEHDNDAMTRFPMTILVRLLGSQEWTAYEVDREAVPVFVATRDPANDERRGECAGEEQSICGDATGTSLPEFDPTVEREA